jgi:hypothetical protein
VGGPHVEVWNTSDLSLLESFWGFDPSFSGGVFVGSVAGGRATPLHERKRNDVPDRIDGHIHRQCHRRRRAYHADRRDLFRLV